MFLTSPRFRQNLGILVLGVFCIAGSFAVGLQTSGNVTPISPSEALGEDMHGDMNGDGILNLQDVIITLEIVRGYREATTEQKKLDWTQDGSINLDDALGIVNHLASL